MTSNGIHCQVNVAELKDEAGKQVGYVEIIQDTTSQNNVINNLHELVDNVKKISDQVTMGAKQIADVTQQNSASSEETAVASQELASQADLLNNMVVNY